MISEGGRGDPDLEISQELQNIVNPLKGQWLKRLAIHMAPNPVIIWNFC